MNVKHGCGKKHSVFLVDDGTLDTVLEIDGHEVRYSEADRDRSGAVREQWVRECVIEACQDGLLDVQALGCGPSCYGPDEDDE